MFIFSDVVEVSGLYIFVYFPTVLFLVSASHGLSDTDWWTINWDSQSRNISNALRVNAIMGAIIVMKIKWGLKLQSCAKYFEIFLIFLDALSLKLFGNS